MNVADSLTCCAIGLRAAPFNGGLLIVLRTLIPCRAKLLATACAITGSIQWTKGHAESRWARSPVVGGQAITPRVGRLLHSLWQATFQGECGRPYKFTITMDGRQVGESVLFKGTTDLGEKNGGVFDWIGRATDKEFVGFFTSATHVGEFRLDRQK